MTSSAAAEFSRRSSSSASTKLLINITASSSTAQTRNNGVNSNLSFSHKDQITFWIVLAAKMARLGCWKVTSGGDPDQI